MELILDTWKKWFRTQGSVRNLYTKKSKKFRIKGSVRNFSQMMSKRFRTDGFVWYPNESTRTKVSTDEVLSAHHVI